MALKNLSTRAAADAGVDIEIFHPSTGENLGIIITMLGSDSQAYIDAERKISGRQKEQAKRTRDFSIGLDYDHQQRALVQKMTACFVSWKERTGDTYKSTIELEPGVELEPTPENFEKLITDRGFFWLRQQVQTGMDNVANFLPNAAGSSSPEPNSGCDTTDPTRTA